MRALAALLGLVSCTGSGSPDTVARIEWAHEDVVGCYGDHSTVVDGRRATVDDLLLNRDGSYRSWVSNGSFDECGTVEGMGLSEGQWRFDGRSIVFLPSRETPDIIVRFADITAEPQASGIRLIVGDHDTLLKPKSRPTFIDPE